MRGRTEQSLAFRFCFDLFELITTTVFNQHIQSTPHQLYLTDRRFQRFLEYSKQLNVKLKQKPVQKNEYIIFGQRSRLSDSKLCDDFHKLSTTDHLQRLREKYFDGPSWLKFAALEHAQDLEDQTKRCLKIIGKIVVNQFHTEIPYKALKKNFNINRSHSRIQLLKDGKTYELTIFTLRMYYSIKTNNEGGYIKVTMKPSTEYLKQLGMNASNDQSFGVITSAAPAKLSGNLMEDLLCVVNKYLHSVVVSLSNYEATDVAKIYQNKDKNIKLVESAKKRTLMNQSLQQYGQYVKKQLIHFPAFKLIFNS